MDASSVLISYNKQLYIQKGMTASHKLIILLSLLNIIRDRNALNFKHNKYANNMVRRLRSDLIINHEEK
jgi:hypothetical protein